MADPERVLTDWLARAAAAVERDLDTLDVLGALDLDALARIAVALRDCRADLASIAATVEGRLAVEMGEKVVTVEGVGAIEARKRTKRSGWDNDGLTRRVVALALDERTLDEATGEYEPAHEAVARVLSECARPAWRVAALRRHGVQPDEWCHEESDGWAVRLPARRTPKE